MDSLADKFIYQFKNKKLLDRALTHPSCHIKQADGTAFSYQRLEFLGDSILGACISMLLVEHFPNEPEGHLAKRKSVLVAKDSIAEVVQRLGLHEHIRFSETEARAGGAQNKSVQEDVGEAIIGAIFLDGGFDAAQAFVSKHWLEKLLAQKSVPIDSKTALQEWAQGNGLPLPHYELLSREGAAHAPIFTIQVTVKGLPAQQSQSSTKRKAEQAAAEQLLEIVQMGDNGA